MRRSDEEELSIFLITSPLLLSPPFSLPLLYGPENDEVFPGDSAKGI